MKILISWIAFNNDFLQEGGGVDKTNSPNYLFHKYFYCNYDKHIILSASKVDDTKINFLITAIRNDFKNHITEECYMDINDVIDLYEIKTKVETKLLEFSNDEIDIFFSPGTSIMQVAWYICHSSLGLKTRLLQTRPAVKSRSGNTELIEINTEQSTIPFTAILKENAVLAKDQYNSSIQNYLITESIKPVYARAYKISQTDKVTTLISGESGTGKEHLAKFIHDSSIRLKQPFIAINCSAFHDSLLESRLFGYKKGAFTDAKEDTKGLFELASGGTIFLDEIGDISPYMQQSLLRVIQENEITPIGGTTRRINTRIIAATNKNLPEKCKEGIFRWDLYYRLAVAELELPALRNRGKTETEELLSFFLKSKKKELKKSKILRLSKDAKLKILNYPFPGNVRELENLVESLYVFCEDDISQTNLPQRFNEIPEEISFKWQDIEKNHIERVLMFFKGNQRQTFLALGYGSINTLRKKIKEHKIKV
jgi:transcriptional regulator with PAS, ATPase and Fis domain